MPKSRKVYGDGNIGINTPVEEVEVRSIEHKHNEDKTCLEKKEMGSKSFKKNRNRLIMASLFCLIFMCGEIVGGILANSIAIISDAAHLLSDLAGFLISLSALILARRPATKNLSFGFYRLEILGAIVSVLLIWVLTAVLLIEAIDRAKDPPDVDGMIMTIVAIVGLAINIILGIILFQGGHGHSHGGLANHHESYEPVNDHDSDEESQINSHGHSHSNSHGHSHDSSHGHSHSHSSHGHSHGGSHSHSHGHSSHGHSHDLNINVRSAFIHVLGDAIQSIGVMIAGIIVWIKPEYKIADPICTFIFSIIVLFTTIGILKDAIKVLMEGIPSGIDLDVVKDSILSIEGVKGVHGLHVWSITIGRPALSVHVIIENEDDSGAKVAEILKTIETHICKQFNIHHTTIQVEQELHKMDTKDTNHC